MSVRLYGPMEIARLLEVTPPTVSNWIERGAGPLPPHAFHKIGSKGHVYRLWTGEQLAPLIAERAARIATTLNELRGES